MDLDSFNIEIILTKPIFMIRPLWDSTIIVFLFLTFYKIVLILLYSLIVAFVVCFF